MALFSAALKVERKGTIAVVKFTGELFGDGLTAWVDLTEPKTTWQDATAKKWDLLGNLPLSQSGKGITLASLKQRGELDEDGKHCFVSEWVVAPQILELTRDKLGQKCQMAVVITSTTAKGTAHNTVLNHTWNPEMVHNADVAEQFGTVGGGVGAALAILDSIPF